MTVELPPTLKRLARVNPVPPDDALGESPVARAALERILATERSAPRRRAARHGRRMLIVVLAALLLAVGAAVAATDPFGLFRDPNPGSAIFGVDPSRHVTPPTEFHIACPHPTSPVVACGAHLTAQRYMLVDHVLSPGPTLSRARMAAAIRTGLRKGQISAQGARRLESDLAAVSDEFLARFNESMRFGTFSDSLTSSGGKAPPAGVPSLLICQPAGAALSCRDMNGDDSAAVGSGIYTALPAPGWRPAPPHQPDPSYQLEVAILGHRPTAAEMRFEIDLVRYGTTSSGSSSTQPQRAPAPAH